MRKIGGLAPEDAEMLMDVPGYQLFVRDKWHSLKV
jgi:hypothetical protein